VRDAGGVDRSRSSSTLVSAAPARPRAWTSTRRASPVAGLDPQVDAVHGRPRRVCGSQAESGGVRAGEAARRTRPRRAARRCGPGARRARVRSRSAARAAGRRCRRAGASRRGHPTPTSRCHRRSRRRRSRSPATARRPGTAPAPATTRAGAWCR
jgi:hypothetical protein